MSDSATRPEQTPSPPQGAAGGDVPDRFRHDFITITSGDGIGIVERLRESHADERGRAFLVRLDPLIARLGEKWGPKSEAVWSYLSEDFKRRLDEPNWCVRINDDAWLTVIPAFGARKGAITVAEIWGEVCNFFIGTLSGVAPPLFEVRADDVNRLRLTPIDLKTWFDRDEDASVETVRAKSMTEQQTHDQATIPGAHMTAIDGHGLDQAASTETSSLISSQRNEGAASGPVMHPIGGRPVMVAAMVAYAGRSLKVASAVEPLFEMKKMVMIGHRLESLVLEHLDNALLDRKALANMDWNLREQVDVTNIEQGLHLLRTRDAENRKMLMVVPAAFSTFASARARAKITQEVSKAAQEMGLKVLFEVRGLDGVPPHRVLEIVSLIKPFCMTVVGGVSPERKAIAQLTKCGLSGVCLEYDGVKREDAALGEYLTALSAAAKAAAGACMVQGFDNYRQMAVARLSGVTHASIKATAIMSPRGN